MGFFRRLFGICRTPKPADPNCWQLEGTQLQIDLSRTPELAEPDGAVRLEGKPLPERVLIVHGRDDRYHALQNRCTHMGRRIDPLSGTTTIQCCSVGKSTYDYDGNLISGSAKTPLQPYPLQQVEGMLLVDLS